MDFLNHGSVHWERMAQKDPLWAVLTEPGKEKGRWAEEDFLATGIRDVEAILKAVTSLGGGCAPRRRWISAAEWAGSPSRWPAHLTSFTVLISAPLWFNMPSGSTAMENESATWSILSRI